MEKLYGGIEAGGTKFVCCVGTGPDDLRAEVTIPTSPDPRETIGAAIAFLKEQAQETPLAAVGIASFGPLDLDQRSATYGFITSTPKPGWRFADLVGPVRAALGCPVAIDTDVNGAALSEHRWGAARGLGTFVYLTVGTGIGGRRAGRWPADARPRPSGDGAHPDPVRPWARAAPGRLPVPRPLPGGTGLRPGDAGALGPARPRRCRRTTKRGSWRRISWRSGSRTW